MDFADRYGPWAVVAGASEGVEAVIKSPDRGDEARLLSSFLGWLDRHFGEHLSSVNIKYRQAGRA